MISTEEKKRITKLIEFMESLPKAANKHFNMGSFLDHTGSHQHPVPKSTKQLMHSCGTTACALGWAATMPYFRRRGLAFRQDGHITQRGMNVIVHTGSTRWGPLFGGWNEDATPKQWAKRARRLLKEWSAAR